MFEFVKNKRKKPFSLEDFWGVDKISENGIIYAGARNGFVFELRGVDGTFFSSEQLKSLHFKWRTTLRILPDEELQIVFRKRTEFSNWVEAQLSQAFLANSSYGRKILLDRLADSVLQMSLEEPTLLSQKIIVCFWTKEPMDDERLNEKRLLVKAQLSNFGSTVAYLDRSQILKEIGISARDHLASESQDLEWPAIKIEAAQLLVDGDRFRALELTQLPENFTEMAMTQALTKLPYPMDICVRLKARDIRPIVSRLERKRNLLHAQRSNKSAPSPNIDSQLEQIDQVMRGLADSSDNIFDMRMTVGLRFPQELSTFQNKALSAITRAAAQMDFCEFEESTIGTFDSYLECIPTFSGENVRAHTVLGSNAIHFLPFFLPAGGDHRSVVTFQNRSSGLYSIDPVDEKLANYNWLVSGTSGSGKSFFVNSLIAQSLPLNPNVYIVDIGGSYNKLTQFIGGRVLSLEPGQGFVLSPFFLAKCKDPKEERMRRQHIFQIFLEMTRVDGELPNIEVRHLLAECLDEILRKDHLPHHPISHLVDLLEDQPTSEAARLRMLLRPWTRHGYFGQFLDTHQTASDDEKILTFDLKGLTEFEDLARVVQLIVCASVWARIRQTAGQRFSWIVLDEVAFSLLKSQPEFVDELISTLRKYYGGAVVVVQDLEKITSNLAGSSILQNTHSKAILQQRGDPRNYSAALSLSQKDLSAIESLQREKGLFSDIFLIRDNERTIIRHVPSQLEYWLATTAPEDAQTFAHWMNDSTGTFQNRVINFVSSKGRIQQ